MMRPPFIMNSQKKTLANDRELLFFVCLILLTDYSAVVRVL